MADLSALQGATDALIAKLTADKNIAVAAIQSQLDLANQTILALQQQIADTIAEALAIVQTSTPT